MKAGGVYARFGHHSSKAGHEIQWFENHAGGVIAVGCFEFVAQLAVPGQLQALLGFVDSD